MIARTSGVEHAPVCFLKVAGQKLRRKPTCSNVSAHSSDKCGQFANYESTGLRVKNPESNSFWINAFLSSEACTSQSGNDWSCSFEHLNPRFSTFKCRVPAEEAILKILGLPQENIEDREERCARVCAHACTDVALALALAVALAGVFAWSSV